MLAATPISWDHQVALDSAAVGLLLAVVVIAGTVLAPVFLPLLANRIPRVPWRPVLTIMLLVVLLRSLVAWDVPWLRVGNRLLIAKSAAGQVSIGWSMPLTDRSPSGYVWLGRYRPFGLDAPRFWGGRTAMKSINVWPPARFVEFPWLTLVVPAGWPWLRRWVRKTRAEHGQGFAVLPRRPNDGASTLSSHVPAEVTKR